MGEDTERIAKFEKGAQAYAKKIIAKFKDYEFVSFNLHCVLGECLVTGFASICSIPENP